MLIDILSSKMKKSIISTLFVYIEI